MVAHFSCFSIVLLIVSMTASCSDSGSYDASVSDSVIVDSGPDVVELPDNKVPIIDHSPQIEMNMPKPDATALPLDKSTPDSLSSKCGDGKINGTEQCDASDLGGKTCVSLGFKSGVLSCGSSCLFDTSGCKANCTGVCTPGKKETSKTGCQCGAAKERVCTTGCSWGLWSACKGGTGVCTPGKKQKSSAGCTGCDYKEQTCTSMCAWGTWSACKTGGTILKKTITSTKNISVWGHKPNNRWPNWIRVGLESTGQWHAYNHFDLTANLPVGAMVKKCQLTLNATGKTSGKSTRMRIRRVSDSWDMKKINHANQPGTPSTIYADFTITQLGKVTLDITPLAKHWIVNNNHGMKTSAKKTNEPAVDFATPTIYVEYCN